jgi:hypothetical protein
LGVTANRQRNNRLAHPKRGLISVLQGAVLCSELSKITDASEPRALQETEYGYALKNILTVVATPTH